MAGLRKVSKKDDKIQLRHPEGKHAVRISTRTYKIMSASIKRSLKKPGSATHTELFKAVSADLKSRGASVNGSIEWYMEVVKLDLLARRSLKRVRGTAPQRLTLGSR